MPKMKTHRATKKRVSFTGTGKIKRNRMNRRHLLNVKTSSKLFAFSKSWSNGP